MEEVGGVWSAAGSGGSSRLCWTPPISSQEGEKEIEIQFSGSIELNPGTISSVSKSLVRSLKEQHCCADWETLLTFNLSCFKNQFCTLWTCGKSKRRCLVPKVRLDGIIGRFHGQHTHTIGYFSPPAVSHHGEIANQLHRGLRYSFLESFRTAWCRVALPAVQRS